jgi:hypothetical protein
MVVKGLRLNGIDGELRTDDFTVMAVHAILRSGQNRGVISFFIEPCGKGENFFGAVFDAVTASFAAFFKDMDNALRHFDVRRIQRNTPEIHSASPRDYYGSLIGKSFSSQEKNR